MKIKKTKNKIEVQTNSLPSKIFIFWVAGLFFLGVMVLLVAITSPVLPLWFSSIILLPIAFGITHYKLWEYYITDIKRSDRT